jgi:2-dehydropantoate 2-reductase
MTGDWPNVAVMGAGAVGCYYGGMLARAGAPVTLIGRAAYVDAIRRDGLRFDGLKFQETIPVAASINTDAVRDADLILFCVKSTDTSLVAREIAPLIKPGALILALQNGVDNPERIAAEVACPVIPAVVYVACNMGGPGHLRHTGRGDLVIGALRGAAVAPTSAQVEDLAATLEKAGVPCRVSDNVEGELWGKLLVNCTYNAISALGRARYKRMTALEETRVLMRAVVLEVLAVAKASGVSMPEGDWVEIALGLSASMPETTSSTAQDLARGKRSEIDHLNGFLARRGAALGIDTPINRTLHALVKQVEDSFD